MDNIEIETKGIVEDPEKFISWLKKHATFVKESVQEDVYFDPPNRSFSFIDKDGYIDAQDWFRIRKSNKGNFICFKHWYLDENGKSTYCDEIETGIESFEQMHKILLLLGYKETSIIKKKRKSYDFQDFRLDYDEVEDLGLFLEVEFVGKVIDPLEGKKKLIEFIQSLNIGFKTIKRGYSWMQWNPEKEHFEKNNI